MDRTVIGRVLWRAAEDEAFRVRSLENLGMALAQEGFILNDTEMHQMRTWWEEMPSLGKRAAAERIQALARGYKY
jgi:hypothetical protein